MITIVHLYFDLLNLHGESGNIKIIESILKKEKIKYKILNKSILDNLEFDSYDFVYIGCGTESNQLLVLNHLLKYREDIRNYINKGKHLLATGNSLEFFGKKISDKKALEIFDYETIYTNKRIVIEGIYKSNLFNKKILGFQNRNSYLTNFKSNLFEMIDLIDKSNFTEDEGFKYNNFYGTYMLGPVLVKNPYLLEFILKSLNFKIKYNFKDEKRAYAEYMKTHFR